MRSGGSPDAAARRDKRPGRRARGAAAIYEHEPRRVDDAIPGLQASDPPVGISVFEPPPVRRSPVFISSSTVEAGSWAAPTARATAGSAHGGQPLSRGRECRVQTGAGGQYPAPVDDAVAALNWAVRVGAEKYGAPALCRGRRVVGRASAVGGTAALLGNCAGATWRSI